MKNVNDLVSFDTPHTPRAYVNTTVRFHHLFTYEERLQAAQAGGWNVFQFPSAMLTGGDLLSDSGTTAQTAEQMSALMLGDEAYGSNWGYFQLLETLENILGVSSNEWEIYLFHQARAAEHALFSHLPAGSTIPANNFFDTTRANAEAKGVRAVDLTEIDTKDMSAPFKGNVDVEKLGETLAKSKENAPLAYLTITNNTGGGQPVSLENMERARDVAHEHGASFFLDACRFAENAWFIKEREEAYKNTPVREIVKKQFAVCDGFTISFKKDGLANIGGALAIRKGSPLVGRFPHLLEHIRDHQILVEGHPTYGGLSGRDIMTIAEGLKQVVKEEYLQSRTAQIKSFGAYMKKCGIPVLEPFGGHAVYIDTDRFFEDTGKKRDDFGGIALTALLLLKGVRLCELGAFAFGSYDTETDMHTFPSHNFIRAAVPRNKYEEQDLFYVADCVAALYKQRAELPSARPISGHDKPLRHFKARFELI